MPNKHLLLIRPEKQARAFITALMDTRTTPLPSVISPILTIQPHPIDQDTTDAQFLMFSSVNAVHTWADHTPNRTIPALCVGDTTTRIATQRGFTAHSAGGNAQDLLALTLSHADPSNGPIYHISGAKTALDLAATLASHGFAAHRIIAYAQVETPLLQAAKTCLAVNSTIVPIFSPHSAALFIGQTQDIALTKAHFVCISENAAQPLLARTNSITLAQNPTRMAMIEAINQLT